MLLERSATFQHYFLMYVYQKKSPPGICHERKRKPPLRSSGGILSQGNSRTAYSLLGSLMATNSFESFGHCYTNVYVGHGYSSFVLPSGFEKNKISPKAETSYDRDSQKPLLSFCLPKNYIYIIMLVHLNNSAKTDTFFCYIIYSITTILLIINYFSVFL